MPVTTVTDHRASHSPAAPELQLSAVLTGDAADLIAQIWAPKFPSPADVDAAAALLPRISPGGDLRNHLLTEGPRPYLRVGPGVIEVRAVDPARAQRTAERQAQAARRDADMLAAYVQDEGELPQRPDPTRVITEWSGKSRSNMTRTLSALDYSPLFLDPTCVPCMLTLTYPGDWLTVAPTGKQVKDHLKALRKRFKRAWGRDLVCVWKLEFQRRGAPHVHMLMVPPHGTAGGLQFRAWVSQAWAAIVDHPDPEERRRHQLAGTGVDYAEGLRASDPRRMAVYFSKHSTFRDKEYQHRVPEEWSEPGSGPGRFWGYWGLRRCLRAVDLGERAANAIGRTLRRWSRAQRTTREVTRPRTPGGRAISKYREVIGIAGAELLAGQAETQYRKTRTRVRRMPTNRGFVTVNDAPALVEKLASWLVRTALA